MRSPFNPAKTKRKPLKNIQTLRLQKDPFTAVGYRVFYKDAFGNEVMLLNVLKLETRFTENDRQVTTVKIEFVVDTIEVNNSIFDVEGYGDMVRAAKD